MENFFRKIISQKIIFKIFWGALLALSLGTALMAGQAANSGNHLKGAYSQKGMYSQMETKKLPIYSVNTEDKLVALTFNCAWNIDDLDSILSTLKKNEIRASFFMTGEWVENYPDAVKKIAKAGHDLASHGDGHKHMNSLSKEECMQEIYGVHKKVFELTGVEMDLFRPPYGEYNDTVIMAAQESGYYPIQWSVDSLDLKNYGVKEMTERVVEHKALENGAIVLMHNGTDYTAKALQGIIDGLKNKGYQFVSVSELIIREGYEIDHAGRQVKK